MEIDFATKKLRKQLTSPQEMIKSFGADRAKRLKQRLEDLYTASNLAVLRSLPQANCHELIGNLKGLLALDISKNWRLLIRPAHDPIPIKPDGGLDWLLVTQVCIEAIEDYH